MNILRYGSYGHVSQFNDLLIVLGQSLHQFIKDYPQMYDKLDRRVQVFLDREFINIASHSTHRIVDIVQYVPQVIKVDNVYTYSQSSERYKRIELHLKVLIKTLLEELDRIKMKTGVVLQIDESIIEMIKK